MLTTSGSLGLLFPPSLAILIYGIVAGVGIDKMFLSGVTVDSLSGTIAAQAGSLVLVGVFTVVVTVVVAFVAKAVFPLRVDVETETTGLDLAQHGERAYELTS